MCTRIYIFCLKKKQTKSKKTKEKTEKQKETKEKKKENVAIVNSIGGKSNVIQHCLRIFSVYF